MRRTLRDIEGPWPERVAATASGKAQAARATSRAQRQNMSPPEVVLWQRLRGQKLLGLKFRRQHVLGPYTADFYCHQVRLVVEVDGYWEHRQRRGRDAARDEWMVRRGLAVVRIDAATVLNDLDSALETIGRVAVRLRAMPTSEHGGARNTVARRAGTSEAREQ